MAKEFYIRLDYVVYAKPVEVFEALSKDVLIKKWSEGKGSIDPKVNGDFEWFDGWVKGKVLAFDPGKSLSFTWKPDEWNKKAPYSTVEIKLKSHKAGTEVEIEHYDFPSEEEAKKHQEGWIDHVLEPLNEMFTG